MSSTATGTSRPAGAGPGGRLSAVDRLLGRLPVRAKIVGSLLVAASVALVLGVLAISRMSSMNSSASQLYTQGLLPLQRIMAVQIDIETTRRDVLNHALSMDDATQAKYESAVKADYATFAADLDTYARTGASADLVDQLRQAYSAYATILDEQLIPASRKHDLRLVTDVRDNVAGPAGRKATDTAKQIAEREVKAAQVRRDHADATYHSSRTVIIMGLVAGLLLALGLGLLVSNAILRAVRRVGAAADALASCDLTCTSGLDTRDEFGRMAAGLDTAIRTLRDTVHEVIGTAGALADASGKLSSVSTELNSGAGRASAQAAGAAAAADQVNAGVQSVTAGAEEMTASIAEIASSAGKAAAVAQESLVVAQATNDHIAQLREASSEIGSVVALITSIAEQTNLLALNATIEAARAGEAGKGFAVVATEVKELAQETAKATHDITQRIEAIQTTSAGAGAAVQEIQQVINQISEFTVAIAGAVEEQSATTTDMSRALNEAAVSSQEVSRAFSAVAEVTSATSDSAAASEGAADDLSGLAAKLNGLVSVFKS